jgi:superfamily II DNA helicase RecQ
MKTGGGFEQLVKKEDFTSCIVSIIFDEAHCISAWGEFRPEYKEVGHLHYILLKNIPIMITSATLPPLVFNDVQEILQLHSEKLVVFHCSSDQPNIHIVVHVIQSSLSSFADLKFILCNWKPGDPPPLKFLVFFDDINNVIQSF